MSDIREVNAAHADMNTYGLYECGTCHRTYNSEIALMWCCNEQEEHRRGIYRGSD